MPQRKLGAIHNPPSLARTIERILRPRKCKFQGTAVIDESAPPPYIPSPLESEADPVNKAGTFLGTPSGISEMSERSREVIRHVVDAYVQTGEPIGSRTLSRR